MNKEYRRILGLALASAAIVIVSAVAMATSSQIGQSSAGSIYPFTDVEAQTIEFHTYYRTITLTAEQEAIMVEALTALKAPCCSDRTALTCCCKCNMARSWWGLSKHLIADQGLGVAEVRTAVSEWFEFINPNGFSGDVCYTGRCGRPFRDNGCGGMKEDNVIF